MDDSPTLIDRFLATASERGEAIALSWRGGAGFETCSFADLESLSGRLARALAERTSPGDVVPILGLRKPGTVAAILGAMRAGGVPSYLNPKLKVDQINFITHLTRARCVLAHASFLPSLARAVEAVDEALAVPCLVFGDGEVPFAPHESAAAERLAARAKVERLAWPAAGGGDRPSGPDRPGFVLFTSGSTGRPKGVLVSQGDLLARADAESRWFGLSSRDVLLNLLPFSFDVGLNQLCTALVTGCELCMSDSWTPADIVFAVRGRKVTGISGVPSIWRDMMTSGLRLDGLGGPLRYVTVSGGDLPTDELLRIPSLAAGLKVFKTYGQTEAFRAASLAPEFLETKPKSVGRPFLGVQVYIVRPDGTEAAPGESGEIVHTGLGVMLGYVGGQDETGKRRPNPFRSEADPSPFAIFTGDLGRKDAEGFIYVEGRRDGMLKVAGNRVYPAEIVSVLMQRPGTVDAEVVGVADRAGETVLVAFIVNPRMTETDDEVRRLAAHLPTYMVPRHLVVRDAIEKTASGKPDLPSLRAHARTLVDPDPEPKEIAPCSTPRS
jgi:acyl-CoA synthetase (AMP-forming)/AMP-acid ligase II